MELQTFNKLLALLPEGQKKDELIAKLSTLRKKGKTGGQGLHDEFSLKPVGHIQIEEIDQNGEVVGVLADQPNLVVDGAEEILLRAFSGDPDRILYKNRVLKSSSSPVYHVPLNEIMKAENGENVIVHHPNELWKAVNDDDFEIEYSYYPNTLYVVEETSTEPNQKAFRLVSKPSTNTAPLTAEVYSTFTNLFIGLGDGLNMDVDLNDSRLTYTGTFTGETVKRTENINDEISFSEKISNFEIVFEKSKKGGQISVYINDVLEEVIETFDASLENPVVESKLFDGLNQQEVTNVRIVFSGADESIADPMMVIAGIKFDAFHKGMNGLIHEFENYTNEFRTPTYYNTTSVAPYTITLNHAPVIPESVNIVYNSMEMERVEAIEEVAEGKFFVDELHGVVHFNRALTGLLVTFNTTGQIMQDEKHTTLTSKKVYPQVTGEVPEGELNGSNRVFTLKHKQIADIKVFLNGTEVPQGSLSSQFNVNKNTGTITMGTAPQEGDALVADYTFEKTVNVLKTNFVIDRNKEIIVLDHNKEALEVGSDVNALSRSGRFTIDTSDDTNHSILIDQVNAKGEVITDVEVFYYSDERPGTPTDYRRQVVLKPKEVNEYPWYALDKGSVQFVAEFPELSPNYNVTIREMGLFDGPRMDDNVKGFKGYPVKAFSLVRVGEARKDTSTGLRVTWTITLTDENGNHFEGGK